MLQVIGVVYSAIILGTLSIKITKTDAENGSALTWIYHILTIMGFSLQLSVFIFWFRFTRIQPQLKSHNENVDEIIKQMNWSRRMEVYMVFGVVVNAVLSVLCYCLQIKNAGTTGNLGVTIFLAITGLIAFQFFIIEFVILYKVNVMLSKFFKDQGDRTYPYRLNSMVIILFLLILINYLVLVIISAIKDYYLNIDDRKSGLNNWFNQYESASTKALAIISTFMMFY